MAASSSSIVNSPDRLDIKTVEVEKRSRQAQAEMDRQTVLKAHYIDPEIAQNREYWRRAIMTIDVVLNGRAELADWADRQIAKKRDQRFCKNWIRIKLLFTTSNLKFSAALSQSESPI